MLLIALRYRLTLAFVAATIVTTACASQTTESARVQAMVSASEWKPTDSTSRAAGVYRTWRQYLDAREGRYLKNARTPSPLWVASEQKAWPVYDMSMVFIPDSARIEVTSITPVRPDSSEYRIVTRFSRQVRIFGACADSVMSVTTYAGRNGDQWLLSSPLPNLTSTWQHETIGRITFVVEPGLTFNRERANRSAAFVDSVAAMLTLPPPPPLTYYVLSSPDMACSIQGIERTLHYGPGGGMTFDYNGMVFSGDPVVGEGYLHELVHALVFPLRGDGRVTQTITEGIASWLGGRTQGTYDSLRSRLAEYLVAHPTATLDTLLSPDNAIVLRDRVPGDFVAGAVLSAMVFERGGKDGLKQLLQAENAEGIRKVLLKVFQQSWPAFMTEWRKRVLLKG